MPLITADQLRRAAPAGNSQIIAAIAGAADRVFVPNGLTTLNRVRGFLSVVLEETGNLRLLTENLNYSAERAHAVFPHIFPTIASAQPFAHNQELFANKVYGHRMGNIGPDDGFRYRGQGLIQITGHDNFALLQRLTGLPLLDQPQLVTSAAHMLDCAVALFVRFHGILNFCDTGHFHAVWALVGSGRATGTIINLPAHEAALDAVTSAVVTLGQPSPVVQSVAPAVPLAGGLSGHDPLEANAPPSQMQNSLFSDLQSLIDRHQAQQHV